MSLKIHTDFDQGSERWTEVRRGLVTASTISALITPKTLKVSTSQTALSKLTELAAERITNHTEETGWSHDMQRGTLDEPYARDAYAADNGVDVEEVGFMERELFLQLHTGQKRSCTIGYSPDGLVGDDGLIEIKSRRQRIQLDTILADDVPSANVAQLQTGLFVSGRSWIDFVSYSGGMPLYVKRVRPDEKWQNAIVEALAYAETFIQSVIANYKAATDGLPVTERIDHYGDGIEITF